MKGMMVRKEISSYMLVEFEYWLTIQCYPLNETKGQKSCDLLGFSFIPCNW